MSSIDYEPLWNKSRTFIRRALTARDEGQFEDFCLWSAVSLELLGKAMLARVHPALVADPQDADSLFLPCGKAFTVSPRTIISKTVFARIARLSKGFDQTQVAFCTLMMNRRNADLHSGELPFEGLNPDTWAAKFWRATELMLETNGMGLSDWLGDIEAQRAAELINAAATVLQQAVEARVEKHRAALEETYLSDNSKARIRQQAKGGALVRLIDFGTHDGDILISETCPACDSDGMLSADHWAEDEGEVDWESGTETVMVHYTSLAFRCGVCKLRLDGQEELEHAGLETEFDQEEQREAEYEEPYQNE